MSDLSINRERASGHVEQRAAGGGGVGLGRVPARAWAWLWLALAAVLYTPLIDTEIGQGNVASDLAAIESLVHRHTFFINDSTFIDTIDKFKRGELYFSQKSPIFHLIAAVPYGVVTRMGWTLRTHPEACVRVLTFVMVVLPMGWLLGLIFKHPWVARRRVGTRAALTAAFALGSLVTPFAVTLNHYVLAAGCLMAAVNVLTARGLASRGAAVAAGFWVAASLACDVPPAFLFGAGLGVAALALAPRRLAWLALGAAAPLLLYAALNWQILGSPLPANLKAEEMQFYKGSYWEAFRARGLAGNPGYYQASYARRLMHATVGHKGIYWMMPLLVVATAAAAGLARRRAPGWPLALAWAAFPPLAIALTMYWAWDLSGGAYNIRHVLATAAPLYCVLAHPALAWGRAARWGLGAAAAWGCLVAGIGVLNPWSHNTFSAWPPLENVARFALARPTVLPSEWIGGVIDATSVTPEVGWLDLGETYLNQRRPREAEWALKEAVRAKPGEPLPYYHLGIAQDMQRKPLEAIASYRKLLELEPKNLGGWNNLGVFAMNVGDLPLAREAYRKSLELAPGNASGTWGELMLGGLEGKPDVARLKAAMARYPGDGRLRMLAQQWGVFP